MATILFNGAGPFELIVNILSTEDTMLNLVKTAQAVLEKKTFKEFIHVYNPEARADNPQGIKV